jgi:hypothetical protein
MFFSKATIVDFGLPMQMGPQDIPLSLSQTPKVSPKIPPYSPHVINTEQLWWLLNDPILCAWDLNIYIEVAVDSGKLCLVMEASTEPGMRHHSPAGLVDSVSQRLRALSLQK